MEKERILVILREHESELKADGLLKPRLSGCVARGENTPESDVDLLVDYDESKTGSLLGACSFEERVTPLSLL